MSYLNYLYQDLIDVISTYLDYTSLNILESEYKFKINYESLLRNRYPAFYKMLKFVKENDIKYKNYPYDQAYNLMKDIEEFLIIMLEETYEESKKKDNPFINISLTNKIESIGYDINTIVENDIDEFITTIYDNSLHFDDLLDIISSYTLLNPKSENIGQEEKELTKYKTFMPHARLGNEYFRVAILNYINHNKNIDVIIENSNKYSVNSIVTLYSLFLCVLEYKGPLTEIKDKILNYKLKKKHSNDEDRLTETLLYHRILDYINKNS